MTQSSITRGPCLWTSVALAGNVAKRCGGARRAVAPELVPWCSAAAVPLSFGQGVFQTWRVKDTPPERVFLFIA